MFFLFQRSTHVLSYELSLNTNHSFNLAKDFSLKVIFRVNWAVAYFHSSNKIDRTKLGHSIVVTGRFN